MTYEEALEYIHGTYAFGSKLGLDNVRNLLEKLGNPEQDLKIIHVAGTNGKGSVSAMLHSVLVAAGWRTGLYTSPYVQHFTERIRMNHKNIPQEILAALTEEVKEAVQAMVRDGCAHPTEFEVVTAIGFLYFAREEADVVVLEVGLGGRLDATNVVEHPLCAVITPVDYDHMEHLGDTLGKIAGEKAGIIKSRCPVVVGKQEPEALEVIREMAAEREAILYQVEEKHLTIHENRLQGQLFSVMLNREPYARIPLALPGRHQIDNALLVMTVLQVLAQHHQIHVDMKELRRGLGTVRWIGRMEVVGRHPLFVLDGAHNEAGAKALAACVKDLMREYPLTLLVGMLKDKDSRGMLTYLLPLARRVVATQPDNPRALAAEDLAGLVKEMAPQQNLEIWVEPSPVKGAEAACDCTPEEGAVLCCGSLYLLGSVRQWVKTRERSLS